MSKITLTGFALVSVLFFGNTSKLRSPTQTKQLPTHQPARFRK